MRKRARKKSRDKHPTKPRDWISVHDPDAPAEGSDAGDDSDLEAARISSTIQGYRTRANQHFAAAAKEAKARRTRQADLHAREAIKAIVRAFWWAEDTAAEEAQHKLMHRIGRWTRRNLGCHVHFNGKRYEHVCPIRIAHKRMGLSIGYVTNPICSICGEELSESHTSAAAATGSAAVLGRAATAPSACRTVRAIIGATACTAHRWSRS